MWIPLEGDPALSIEEDDTWYVNVRIARLADGATLEQANAEVLEYAAEVQRRLPGHFEEEQARSATVRSISDYIAGESGSVIRVALGAVSLVLLIACANVTNLLLARGDARAPDLAVRSALGASRGRVARMLLAETCLLGFAGGATGIAMGFGLVRLLSAQAPNGFSGVDSITMNLPVLAYAIAITATSTIVSGLMPAIRVSRIAATRSLGGLGRGTASKAPGGLSPILVGTQIALAVVVTVGSGLMLRSLTTLLATDPGMDGHGVLTLKPIPPASRYPDGTAFRNYYRQVSDRLSALLGILQGPGTVALLGEAARHARAVVRAVEDLQVVAIDSDLVGWTDTPGVSRAVAGPGLPFFSRMLRGVVVDGRLARGWLEEAIRVVAPMSRVIVIRSPDWAPAVLEESGLSVMISEAQTVVAARG